MTQPTVVMQDSHRLADRPISRRMLLASSTGLIETVELGAFDQRVDRGYDRFGRLQRRAANLNRELGGRAGTAGTLRQ